MVSREASCSCGQLRIEVKGEPLGIGVCHCLSCQRRTGSVFATLASFAAPYRVFGTASEFVAVAIRRNLLIIPGNVFSRRDTHFRISYAVDDTTLARGLDVLSGLAGAHLQPAS